VTVKIWSGTSTAGAPLHTLVVTRSGGSWSTTAPTLAEGPYTAVAEQSDDAGNTGSSSASIFTIDTSAPNTMIDAGPSGTVAVTDASFSFSSPDGAASFQCRLDGGGFAACSSPKSYTGLSDGAHNFEVRAVDAAGNVDPTPAQGTWTVDTAAPALTLVSPASGSSTNDSTPALSGAAGTAVGDSSTVTVKVWTGAGTSGSPVRTLTTTQSTGSWSTSVSPALPDGVYTARAEQSDSAGNTGLSGTRTFTIDTAPPDTSIGDAPAGTVSSTDAVFEFTSTEANSSFECRLDGGGFAACSSPKSYTGLSGGPHAFEVRATDPAGNTDASAATQSWTIDTSVPDTTPPAVTLTSPADGSATNDTTPALAGTAGALAGDSSLVTVKIWSGSIASGSPLHTLTTIRFGGSWSMTAPALGDGTYTARAEQSDVAANVGVSAASTFTVDTVAELPAVQPATPLPLPSIEQLPDLTVEGAALSAPARLRLASALRRGVPARVACGEPCTARLRLLLATRLARRLGIARSVVVGRGSARLTAPGSRRVRVRFSDRARRELARARSVRLALRAVISDAAGNRRTLTRRVTLRR
jgi:hypothetical protein